MQSLRINPRFQGRFGKLEPEQLHRLKLSLLDEQTGEPIIYWIAPDGVPELVEGHNRYAIAQAEGVELPTFEKHFDDEDAAYNWMLRHQATRRNLGKYERDELIREIVKLESDRFNTKTEAVQSAADVTGVGIATAWRAVTPVQQFYADKQEFERDLEREKTQAAEKLRQQAQIEGWDESRMESEWASVGEQIEAEFADRAEMLESASQEMQDAGVKGGGRGKGNKSAQAIAAQKRTVKAVRRAMDTLEGVLREARLLLGIYGHFERKGIEDELADVESKFPEPKKRFGR